jgi:hypothetical protein
VRLAERIIAAGEASGVEALAAFDSLEGVTVEFMLGRWRAMGIRTGHPLDGVLEAYGWWGKEFVSANEGYPLLFRIPGGAVQGPSEASTGAPERDAVKASRGAGATEGEAPRAAAASERFEHSGLVSLDPRFLPVRIGMTLPFRRTRAAAMAFRAMSRLIRTSESRAVLQVTKHRGVTTVAMSYLDQPVTDYFRRVDDQTVLAMMELEGDARRYFFALTRA